MERILKTTDYRRGQEDNPQSSLSDIPPHRHQNMESSSCSYLLTSLAIEKEQDEQQEVIYTSSGHRPNSTNITKSDESDSSRLLSAIHFAFNDDDDIESSSHPRQREEFLQDDDKEVIFQGVSSRKRTPPSPPPSDALCLIGSQNHDERTADGTLILEDDDNHIFLLQQHSAYLTQEDDESRRIFSFFEQIQAEEDKDGNEDQTMMIMPPVGDIIFLDDNNNYRYETPHDTDANSKRRRRRSLMVTPPTNSSEERSSVLYNVSASTSIGANTISSYNSSPTSSYNSSINSTGTLHHEDEFSSSCLSKSKKEVPFFPSFLIDQKSPQSYSSSTDNTSGTTTRSCRSSLLQSMKQTTRTQDLIRKEKKKIKLHDSFVDKDVLQELMYCIQDSKKSRDKLRQFLGGRHARDAGGRTTK